MDTQIALHSGDNYSSPKASFNMQIHQFAFSHKVQSKTNR